MLLPAVCSFPKFFLRPLWNQTEVQGKRHQVQPEQGWPLPRAAAALQEDARPTTQSPGEVPEVRCGLTVKPLTGAWAAWKSLLATRGCFSAKLLGLLLVQPVR